MMTPVHSAVLENEVADITSIYRRVQTQEVSPSEVVRACLERIDQLNPKLNAFITVLADEALKQARVAEQEIKAGKWRGPLHGIPVGIKDFYDTAGIRTTAADDHLKDRVPTKDAAGVARLKEAGAIVIGKTNMHRLGMGTTGLDSYFGPVHNPWNDQYIPGGSSSGSAAAVASGMCYATLDTDAIGSCRLPAACCGVVGFKGTYGLIDASGILEGEEDPGEMIRWFNSPGIMTRTVEDAAWVLDVLSSRSERTASAYSDGLAKDRKMRVGVGDNFRAEEDVRNAFEQAVEKIRGLGFSVTNIGVPFRDPAAGLDSIEADRKAIGSRTFKDIDVLLLPTTTTTVPTIKDAGTNPQALSPENTVFANYYGLPAISVPCGFDKNGLPLGLQIVGRPGDEASVLHVAYRFEKLESK
jgi:aspartyl-tRNA(Asn)/glutamyl-tRNA(Gln) amidotransferase subunit A